MNCLKLHRPMRPNPLIAILTIGSPFWAAPTYPRSSRTARVSNTPAHEEGMIPRADSNSGRLYDSHEPFDKWARCVLSQSEFELRMESWEAGTSGTNT